MPFFELFLCVVGGMFAACMVWDFVTRLIEK